ncbi:polyprenyl synthetase family protein [Pseudobacteroides cellulosolvens]|uniref:Farnesyltranstransferase n=1 Tax=Pseudobacteroides cellulosolvens ATCC 35603 = DSM 2933 TaxID=398512 RepID=A0A0L6JHU5_9FIRM|nr:polyprenyl synthetase family protein [Pseudobacteroides cellulosolvens]KNY25275.1 Farnesyltranstransferase [Pseudobacteroides cellulosolvens ATCC 35603 = DSM 2933]
MSYNHSNITSYKDNTPFINADECYEFAVKRAGDYFNSLLHQVTYKEYIPILVNEFKSWKKGHMCHFALTGYISKHIRPDPKDYNRYIQWLKYSGRLENYLDRSISYIFMRDLGKDLSSPDTHQRIRRVVERLKNYLIRYTGSDHKSNSQILDLSSLYRKAQEEHIESTMIWLMDKLKEVSAHLPEGMDAEQAERKLVKIIAGVLMHEFEGINDSTPTKIRMQKLDVAIRLGYSYGLTYPFIDDILDANVLSPEEKSRYSNLIRTSLLNGSVPELGIWPEKNRKLVSYMHSELREAFLYIKSHQSQEHLKSFFEQAYVFFNSQEIDRIKELSNSTYTNEDLYIPIILKSSSSRLIARSVSDADEDRGFDERTFYYGIYNQLADDFADMFDDMEESAVTPYTYWMKYRDERPDLINPFELYWTVISNLIHNVYNNDAKTSEVILDRAINGLKRCRERLGAYKYNELMSLLTSNISEFNDLVQELVMKADDVDFFDKLLRDHMLTSFKNERNQRNTFKDTIENIRHEINSFLNIAKSGSNSLLSQTVVDAANYSIEAAGKRLRPLIAWIIARDIYRLEPKTLFPLFRSIEYMHSASLIYDDLPSQDNADTRRGRKTLHNLYDLATAELTGLYLTQKAIEEQTYLNDFSAEAILRIVRYSCCVTQDMCKGQLMDLQSKGKNLTLEELDTICFYKTGIAFEASLVMPAILAGARDCEIEALKRFARFAGITFQIKDDLLDAEGDASLLGKPTGKDILNSNSTFVTALGLEEARKEMWNHFCNAMESLNTLPHNITFLKHLLLYIINRDH